MARGIGRTSGPVWIAHGDRVKCCGVEGCLGPQVEAGGLCQVHWRDYLAAPEGVAAANIMDEATWQVRRASLLADYARRVGSEGRNEQT